MDIPSFIQALYDSGLGEWGRTSLRGLPIVEALHVVAIAVVFGTIMIVDLRLLGFPNVSRSFLRTSQELLKYTWGAFVLAVITGVVALGASSDLEDELVRFPGDADALSSAKSDAFGFGLATDILMGTAVAAAAVSTYFTVD